MSPVYFPNNWVSCVVEGDLIFSTAVPFVFSDYQLRNERRHVMETIKRNAETVTVRRRRGRPRKVAHHD